MVPGRYQNAELIKLDILEQTGKGRSTRYVFKKK